MGTAGGAAGGNSRWVGSGYGRWHGRWVGGTFSDSRLGRPIQSDVRSCQSDVRYSYAHKFVMCGDVRFSGTPHIQTYVGAFVWSTSECIC